VNLRGKSEDRLALSKINQIPNYFAALFHGRFAIALTLRQRAAIIAGG
jgi:hypothetical protein